MNRSDDLFPQPGGTPDPYWQRAFDDAFETPPPRVWEGVERQLDLDESDGILPLWQHQQGRQSMLFGRWAAGIAASLLLTALGWWAWHREGAIRPDVSVAVVPKSAETPASGTFAPTGPSVAHAEATKVNTLPLPRLADAPIVARHRIRTQPVNQSGAFARNTPAPVGTSVPGESIAGTSLLAESITSIQPAAPGLSVGTLGVANKPGVQVINGQVQQANLSLGRTDAMNGTLVFSETTMSTTTIRGVGTHPFQSSVAGIQPSTMSRSVVTRSMTMQSFTSQAGMAQTPAGQLPPGTPQPASQATLPASERSVIALTNDAPERATVANAPLVMKQALRPQANDTKEAIAEPAIAASKKRRDHLWVSAGMGASSFNPAVALRTTFSPTAMNMPQGIATGNTATVSPTLQNQVGRAVAFQAGVGIPLGEHWSIESGVGYLSGQNEIQSPARISSLTSALKSASTDNLYADLVTRLANQYVSSANFASADKQYDYLANQASNYTSSQQQTVSNTYQFVQVPVQVGYELRPRRKFGLALLTGMVSNWFVRNTIAESITIKANDGIYRPVTLAGTAGMRLRYRPDNYWSASVAGTFQQSLQSLTQTDISLQAQPQQIGLSFSVDRHF